MDNPPPVEIARMPFAAPNEAGDAIVFRFECRDDESHTFACPPGAIPEIVARLLAAAERLSTQTGLPAQGALAKISKVSVNDADRTVGIALYPTESTGIPFALTPQHARKLSSDLAHAASTVDPQEPQNTD